MSVASGKRIKMARVAKSLTQGQLGELVGLTAARVGQLEAGAMPRVSKAALLAKALGTTVETLFTKRFAAKVAGVEPNKGRQVRRKAA